jgi:hypothetical protein
MIMKTLLVAAIIGSFASGAFLQLVADAVQDCERDPIAFPEACQFVQEHSTIASFFAR